MGHPLQGSVVIWGVFGNDEQDSAVNGSRCSKLRVLARPMQHRKSTLGSFADVPGLCFDVCRLGAKWGRLLLFK